MRKENRYQGNDFETLVTGSLTFFRVFSCFLQKGVEKRVHNLFKEYKWNKGMQYAKTKTSGE